MEKVKHELTLSTTHGITLKGTRIVMPTTLQQRVIDLAHEGHQGIVKTKKLLREEVWFHRVNNMVGKKKTHPAVHAKLQHQGQHKNHYKCLRYLHLHGEK